MYIVLFVVVSCPMQRLNGTMFFPPFPKFVKKEVGG